MRIATWNLERGGQSQAAKTAQKSALNNICSDVLVLTEPPPSYSSPQDVCSPKSPTNCSWVAIVGESVQALDFEIPYERMAVAARVSKNGETVIVYGSVLPWLAIKNHAPELVRDNESSFETFRRVLSAQANDIVALQCRYREPVIWAGDFNQTLAGPNNGGSNDCRKALAKTLRYLDMIAWNEALPHAVSGLHSIDLICGPETWSKPTVKRIDPVRDGVTMPDHAGYFVDVKPAAL